MPADFEETLVAARTGAGWAYASLFEWLGRPVAGYLRARRVEDPDDLANEVLLRAFRALHVFQGDAGRFRSLVFTIAHNAALDEYRRARRRPVRTGTTEHTTGPVVADAAETALERLSRERVETLLAALPADQRDVFLLRVVGDLSIAQTAAVLGKSYEAVKALQRRGAANLKQQMSAEGVPR
jgi:RNA polymerase sigma-70 factor (ECF subfamily)